MVLGPPQSTMQTKLQKQFLPCLGIMVVALGLQGAGFGTKGWMIMGYESSSRWSDLFNLNLGLWEAEYCDNNGCISKNIGEMGSTVRNVISLGIEEYQIETSIALAALLIATVALLCTRCCPDTCRRGNLQAAVVVMCFLTLISGILALVASGKFGNDQRKAHSLFKMISMESPFQFPYSLLLTGIGGILAIVASLVILLGVRPWQNNPETPPTYEMASSAPTGPYQQTAVPAGPYPSAAQPVPYYAQPAPYYAQPGGYMVSPGQPMMHDKPQDPKF